jgi:hypothetical protein
MLDDADGGDEQDLAEAFDETHREGEDPNLFDAEDELDPDLDSRAYDVTRADGDEDEDEEDEDLDDLDDDDLDEEDEEEDEEEDVEASRGEGLAADTPESENLVGTDRWSTIRAGADEVDLTLAEDLDQVAAPRDRQADKFESHGPLSDKQIADLGYSDAEHRLDEGLKETFPASDSLAVRRPA